MKNVYIVATPSGRSTISIRDDPRKAFSKTKKDSLSDKKRTNNSKKIKGRSSKESF
jgi:hypothetical protein